MRPKQFRKALVFHSLLYLHKRSPHFHGGPSSTHQGFPPKGDYFFKPTLTSILWARPRKASASIPAATHITTSMCSIACPPFLGLKISLVKFFLIVFHGCLVVPFVLFHHVAESFKVWARLESFNAKFRIP